MDRSALFTDICEPLLSVDDVRGRTVADIGSGTGRIVNMLLDAGAAHVTALEPSESFAVVAANTADRADKVEVIRGDGMAIPQDREFRSRGFDRRPASRRKSRADRRSRQARAEDREG